MAEVGHLRETVQSQVGQMQDMGRRVAELEEAASEVRERRPAERVSDPSE